MPILKLVIFRVGNFNLTNNPASGRIWNVFPNINTASGIIENGEAVGVAFIIRARYPTLYFLITFADLVSTFDLGAGELKFNTSTARTFVRNTVPQVYTKAIFSGFAESGLPIYPMRLV